MKKLNIILIGIGLAFISASTFAASSKSCFHHYAQLKRVQDKIQENQGVEQNAKLQEKQKKARDKWWDCKNGSRVKPKKSDNKSVESPIN